MKKNILRTIFFALLVVFLLSEAASVQAFSFAVLGDTQKFNTSRKGSLRKAVNRISASGADFTFMMGDFCSGKKCAKKLRRWKSAASPLFPDVYPVHGNHDAVSSGNWQSTFNPPTNGPSGYIGWTYSFDFENSHFVVLDSDRSQWHLINQTQRAWLEQDLAATAKENIFVFFHEPAFPVSKKIGNSLDANPSDRDALWEILDGHNVTAVFSGHEHLFYRKKIDSSVFSGAQNSIYQFTVGNTACYAHPKPRRSVEYYYRQKSYLLVEADGSQITTKLYSPNGALLNTFSFAK